MAVSQRLTTGIIGVAVVGGGIYAYHYKTKPQRKEKVDSDRDQLLLQHQEIWNLMQLSKSASDELQSTVDTVYQNIEMNKMNDSSFMDRFNQPNRHENFNVEQYISSHKKRFDNLGLSENTKKELINSAEWVWNVLHNNDFNNDTSLNAQDLERAQIITQMMKDLNGPPACCDDNIFLKAQK